ncbi:hypothetical protein DYH55_21370 [Methylovirgula sp. 4M-Z18]|nr:hypothetical protein DYH55_21370 [Methylovirgula sp. 4M-Z18]
MVRAWGPIHGASHNTYLFGVDDEDREKVFLASSTIAQQWFAQSHKNARVISICTVGVLKIIKGVDPTLLLRVRSGDSAKDFVFIVGFAGHDGGISFLEPEIAFNSASSFGPEQRQEIYASMRDEKARLPKKTQDALNWL